MRVPKLVQAGSLSCPADCYYDIGKLILIGSDPKISGGRGGGGGGGLVNVYVDHHSWACVPGFVCLYSLVLISYLKGILIAVAQ
jgi:hypothetical protein